MTTTENTQGIDLADAIEAIRIQLVEAAARGANSDIAFEVGPIELEFNVELKVDAHGKAGVRAWVFNAEASAGVESGRGQRVAVTLTPKRRSTNSSTVEVKNSERADMDGF
jgi:hypothetical protein